MQPWEVTLQRARISLAIWQKFAPGLKIGQLGVSVLEGWCAQFEPLAQVVVQTQDALDAAARQCEDTLAKLQVLGTRVPAIIEAQMDDHPQLMGLLKQAYRTKPRTVDHILTRMRHVYPLWAMADEARAALPDPQPPITRRLQGVEHTAAMAQGLLDGYNEEVRVHSDCLRALVVQRTELEELTVRTDRLSKQWYKVVDNLFERGTPEHEALKAVPTLPGTRVPSVLEIRSVKQGGEEGRQALVRYAPKGGERATRLWLRWQVVGVDTDYVNQVELERGGNAVGPYPVGTELRLVAVAANSAASRTSTPRSLVIAAPILRG